MKKTLREAAREATEVLKNQDPWTWMVEVPKPSRWRGFLNWLARMVYN